MLDPQLPAGRGWLVGFEFTDDEGHLKRVVFWRIKDCEFLAPAPCNPSFVFLVELLRHVQPLG